jgi:hypothetical protein
MPYAPTGFALPSAKFFNSDACPRPTTGRCPVLPPCAVGSKGRIRGTHRPGGRLRSRMQTRDLIQPYLAEEEVDIEEVKKDQVEDQETELENKSVIFKQINAAIALERPLPTSGRRPGGGRPPAATSST